MSENYKYCERCQTLQKEEDVYPFNTEKDIFYICEQCIDNFVRVR